MKKFFALTALLLSANVCMPAAAQTHLTVGLLDLSPEKQQLFRQTLAQLKNKISGHQCALVHTGEAGASNGNLLDASYTHYLLIQCTHPLLSNTRNLEVFRNLKTLSQSFALLEGRSDNPFAAPGDGGERLYVLKIGRYNNSNPEQRQVDLAAANRLAAQRSPTFHNTAFYYVDTAVGMERPDEVTILYYNSAEAARTFRNKNRDVLSRIAQFNKDHLVSFSYVNIPPAR